ncbi:unnamed protein product [Pedinophyceae sp. YPF-701]|nr:unnamed protein product [Pedinophyceae sp. YPF-701]
MSIVEESGLAGRAPPRDVQWGDMDKRRFFVEGTGLFSAIMTALYPISVIKTRQMAAVAQPGGKRNIGIASITLDLARSEGIRGFYKGYPITFLAQIPSRVIYLSTLEFVKAHVTAPLDAALDPAAAASAASFLAGGTASLAAQTVIVPMDVISQRQMIQGPASKGAQAGGAGGAMPGGHAVYRSAAHAARVIVREEGVRGLYRGFVTSLATYVPSSAVWWGLYGFYNKLAWRGIAWRQEQIGLPPVADERTPAAIAASSADGSTLGQRDWVTVAVQMGSGVAAGLTSGLVMTPVDCVKTRLQVLRPLPGERPPTFVSVARDLWTQEGVRGFYRGVFARMASASLFGTAMVSAYEYLKDRSAS